MLWTAKKSRQLQSKSSFSDDVVGFSSAFGTQGTSGIAINRPRSIYQYSNMALRLSGQTSIFGVVFFVSKSPLGIIK